METIDRINQIIDHLRPYIMADGGDIQFISYVNGVVTVSLTGACAGCSMIDTTLNEGIREWIMSECEEVKDVVLYQEEEHINFEDFDSFDAQ